LLQQNVKRQTTTLVTLYCKAGESKDQLLPFMAKESGSASNIKMKSTRKQVMCALVKIKHRLARLKSAPVNGMVLFASEESVVVIEPDKALSRSGYKCDKTFDTESLKAHMHSSTVVASPLTSCWVHVTGSVATMGHVSQGVETMRQQRIKRSGGAVKRHHKGGQSAGRFQRTFDAADAAWVKTISEWIVAPSTHQTTNQLQSQSQSQPKLPEHLFIGGPAGTGTALVHTLVPKWRAISSVHLCDADPTGFKDQVCTNLIPKIAAVANRSVVETANCILRDLPDQTVVGTAEVLVAANMHILDTLWVEKGLCSEWTKDAEQGVGIGAMLEKVTVIVVQDHSLCHLGRVVGKMLYPCLLCNDDNENVVVAL
jgi:peptide subunit release factor 1 (eRF1)